MPYAVPTDNGEDVVIYVPGYKKSDLEVKLAGNYIIVEGRTDAPYARDKTLYYKLKLNEQVEVDPELADGILVLHCKSLRPQSSVLNIR